MNYFLNWQEHAGSQPEKFYKTTLWQGEHALVGLNAIFDQLGRQNFLRFTARIPCVNAERVGVAENLRFYLLNNPVSFLVRRPAIMARAATRQEQKTPCYPETHLGQRAALNTISRSCFPQK